MRADEAYSSRANRNYLRRRGIRATIIQPPDQAAHRETKGSSGERPPAFGTEIYKQRHAVECGISLRKQHRAVTIRYDKLAVRYQATVDIAAINIWPRHLSNTGEPRARHERRTRRSPICRIGSSLGHRRRLALADLGYEREPEILTIPVK